MKVRIICAIIGVSVFFAAFCHAEIITDFNVGYVPNSTSPHTIALSSTTPTWSANLSSYANFMNDVYCVLGYDSYKGGQGWADAMYTDTDVCYYPCSGGGPTNLFGGDPNVPYVVCGPYICLSTTNSAYIVYKFVLPSGYITSSGGSINAGVIFRGDRTVMTTWVGVGQTFTPHTSSSFITLDDTAAYNKAYVTGGTPGEWDTYEQDLTVNIPTGLNEFYVVICKEQTSSNRLAFHLLTVNAPMVQGAPNIPDLPEYSQFAPGLYPNPVTPRSILLSETNPTWDANLATAPAFANQVHAIMGYNGTHTYADMIYRKLDGGWFGVTHQPYISCDISADGGKVGSFVYKFVLPDGMVTGTGGTINAGCFLRGTPGTLNWVGVAANYYPSSSSYTDIGNMPQFTKAYITGSGWGIYEQSLMLSIPAGVSTFYVAVVSDWGTSNYFGMYSMHVSAALRDAEMPVMLYSVPDNRLLKYEIDRMVANDIGMSGVVLGLSQITDDVNAAGGINTLKQSYKDIIDAAQARNLGMKHFAVKSYMGYVTAAWPANTWATGTAWTKAMANLTATAQACNFAGIRHIIIDGERYTNLDQGTLSGTYMLSLSDATSLSQAYQRGMDVAAAISAAAPNVDVILAPEYGSGYIGSLSSYPCWQKFRSGLLAGSSTLKVYTWVEGTYTELAGLNDDSIQLDGVGTYMDPAAYKTAVTSYLNTISANIRSRTDTPANWDARGGLVPGFWVIGTSNQREGKRSAWYTPKMFAAQLEAYKALNVPLVLEYAPIFAWKQWFGNEVAAAGMYPYDGNYNVDNNNNWVAEVSCHPYLEAYKAVLRARGTPVPMYSFTQAGDIGGDGYVNFKDLRTMVDQWLIQ